MVCVTVCVCACLSYTFTKCSKTSAPLVKPVWIVSSLSYYLAVFNRSVTFRRSLREALIFPLLYCNSPPKMFFVSTEYYSHSISYSRKQWIFLGKDFSVNDCELFFVNHMWKLFIDPSLIYCIRCPTKWTSPVFAVQYMCMIQCFVTFSAFWGNL